MKLLHKSTFGGKTVSVDEKACSPKIESEAAQPSSPKKLESIHSSSSSGTLNKSSLLGSPSRRLYKRKERVRKMKDLKKNKQAAMTYIDQCKLMNSNLHTKMSYFYGPYKCTNQQSTVLPMKFEPPKSELEVESSNQPLPWRKISNLILKQDIESLRE